MKMIVSLLLCGFVCISIGACTEQEGSEETAAQEEPAKVTEAAEEIAIVGKWEITEWKADEIDQMAMWRVGSVTVEFRADGSVESQLAYTEGDGRTSKGTWKRSQYMLEIQVKGGGGETGDEPFERTREFKIDELTDDALAVHAEIGPADKPLVVSYKARRVP